MKAGAIHLKKAVFPRIMLCAAFAATAVILPQSGLSKDIGVSLPSVVAVPPPAERSEELPEPQLSSVADGAALPEGDVPVPTSRPAKPLEMAPAKPSENAGENITAALNPPADAPVPTARPQQGTTVLGAVPQPGFAPDSRSDDIPDLSGKLPGAEIACRARLTQMGVEFEPLPPVSDPSGCSIPYPLSIGSLGAGVALQPEAEMNCAMAESAARFANEVVSPLADVRYGAKLKSATNASAYVCRPRNGTRKLSEHAFGNALDIARFTLTDGTGIDVTGDGNVKDGEFLAAVRQAACGPFKTVLGPGSDADHATHFHLDLAPRRNGGTFCQ